MHFVAQDADVLVHGCERDGGRRRRRRRRLLLSQRLPLLRRVNVRWGGRGVQRERGRRRRGDELLLLLLLLLRLCLAVGIRMQREHRGVAGMRVMPARRMCVR